MIKTSVADAKARLSEYLERAERGEHIVICRHNKPVAALGPVEASRTDPRPLGRIAGRPTFEVGDAFFEPLSDEELDAWEGDRVDAPAVSGRRIDQATRVAEKSEKKEPYNARRTKPTRRAPRRS